MSAWIIVNAPVVVFALGVLVLLVFFVRNVGRAVKEDSEIEASVRNSIKEKNKLVGLAESIGPLWYYNENDGVLAVCRADDFEKAIDKIKQEVEAGTRRPFEEVKPIYIVPTFTFHNSMHRINFAHSGLIDEYQEIKKRLVCWALGINTDGPGGSYWTTINECFGVLIQKNHFLFVPYSSNKPSMEEQWRIYGEKVWTLKEAYTHLLTFPAKPNMPPPPDTEDYPEPEKFRIR